jgi:hypothetical protein
VTHSFSTLRLAILSTSILLFLSFTPRFASSQSFQQPTAEELSMTSDPKAPGADAVYLYREETSDDSYHYHNYYVRIKVLTEKGKELATVRTPYQHGDFNVADIRGRTIHSDGTIIPLTTKPTDLMTFKSGDKQVNEMVFTLPSVEIGSILEYKLDLRYKDEIVMSPKWEVQQPYYVHKAHYKFIPSSTPGHYITDANGNTLTRLMYSTALGNNATVKTDISNHYSLDITDVPAMPSEDWAPPLDSINWHVYFYYTYAASGPEFWQSEGNHWLKQVESFSKVTGSIRAVAGGIIAAGDTEEQMARKLYAAVMKIENTDFTHEKSVSERKAEKLKNIKSAEDVWRQQSGTSDDIALLYYSLALAARLKAWPMQVVNRNRAIFDPTYLNVGQLDDFIVIVNINGKDVYLDPGERYTTFGDLHWKHNLTGGLRINENGKVAIIAGTPANLLTSAITQRNAEITIDETGAITGYARFIMTGPQALYWRQLTLTNDTDEIKKQFNEDLHKILPDGVRADFDHFIGLDDSNVKLVGVIDLSGNLGTATGKRYFLPGIFFESQAKHPFVSQASRFAPIDVHYSKMVQDSVAYHLPTGYEVESTPLSADTNWPQYAVLRIKSTIDGSSVSVNRTFAYNYTLLPAKDYNDLHDYFLKVAAADQQQIVFTRAPAATAPKGN